MISHAEASSAPASARSKIVATLSPLTKPDTVFVGATIEARSAKWISTLSVSQNGDSCRGYPRLSTDVPGWRASKARETIIERAGNCTQLRCKIEQHLNIAGVVHGATSNTSAVGRLARNFLLPSRSVKHHVRRRLRLKSWD
jgi:hypothetical protein